MPTPVTEPAPADVLLQEPAEVYHAKAGEYLSSHLLADFRRCPQLYFRKRCGLVPNEDRPAFLLGRAAHTLTLEGKEAFQSAFAVGGPINPKTGQPFGPTTKAFTEWAETPLCRQSPAPAARDEFSREPGASAESSTWRSSVWG